MLKRYMFLIYILLNIAVMVAIFSKFPVQDMKKEDFILVLELYVIIAAIIGVIYIYINKKIEERYK